MTEQEIEDYVKETCMLGRGHYCCKYLVFGPMGLECAKVDPDMKAFIDGRKDMNARGDNCEGNAFARVVH